MTTAREERLREGQAADSEAFRAMPISREFLGGPDQYLSRPPTESYAGPDLPVLNFKRTHVHDLVEVRSLQTYTYISEDVLRDEFVQLGYGRGTAAPARGTSAAASEQLVAERAAEAALSQPHAHFFPAHAPAAFLSASPPRRGPHH
mgnify:CR=1 FL=1